MTKRDHQRTETSSFGVSRRESHDATKFYERFPAPVLSNEEVVAPCPIPNTLVHGDSRHMDAVPDSCLSMCLMSPGYFVGKEYEIEGAQGHVPSSYVEYLALLEDVFAECWRVLESGGRIAVNVANLGRKPYRSLSGDVTRLLEDLGFLIRGEILWIKAQGANGSCAFGSFMKASNPALRDVSERIVVASKGRFDRAIHWKKRRDSGLPWESTITKEDFLKWTLDTWYFPPASARRIGHPAPFPVELPRRLIELYTYKGDVVLDPFMGAGSTGVAAVQTGRHYVGYDTDADYIDLAQNRLDAVDPAAAVDV